MPQWDFLEFPRRAAAGAIRRFDLRMQAEVTDLIEEGGRVVGVRATTPDGDARRSARRSSSAPTAAARPCASAPASRSRTSARRSTCCGCGCRAATSDGDEPLGRIGAGKMFVMLDRGDYWQCAYRHPEGRGRGGARPRASRRSAPTSSSSRRSMHDRVQELSSWDDVKLLTVQGRPLAAMAPAGAAVHRRRRACDVAGRRRRHQPRRPGRGRGGQPAGRAAARGHRQRRRSRGGAAPPHVPDAGDPAPAGVHAEQRAQRACWPAAARRRRPGRCGWSAAVPMLQRIPARLVGLGVRPEQCWHAGHCRRQPRA